MRTLIAALLLAGCGGEAVFDEHGQSTSRETPAETMARIRSEQQEVPAELGTGPAPIEMKGDLIRGSLPAVYYIGSDTKRYVFTNDKSYFTWYPDFSGVSTVADSMLAAIYIGGNVTYRPGVKMVKIYSDPKVYAVAHHGVLRWVKTESVAAGIYGPAWSAKVDDIVDAFFVNYTIGADIASPADYSIADEMAKSPDVNTDKDL